MDETIDAINDLFLQLCLPEVLLQESNKYIQSNIYHWSEYNDITYVKIDFPLLGLYINSISIRVNPRDPESLWVQMPKFKAGANWIAPLQLGGGSPLKNLLITYSLKAWYEEYGIDGSSGLLDFLKDNFP